MLSTGTCTGWFQNDQCASKPITWHVEGLKKSNQLNLQSHFVYVKPLHINDVEYHYYIYHSKLKSLNNDFKNCIKIILVSMTSNNLQLKTTY